MSKKFGYLLLGIFLNCMPMFASQATMPTVPIDTIVEELSVPVDTVTKEYWYDRMGEYWEKEQYDSALICADNMIKLDSKDINGYMLKASALNRCGRGEEALNVNTKALSMDPNNITAIMNQSYILEGLSRQEESLALINDALGKFPENAGLHFRKARIYVSQGDTTSAMGIYNTLLKIKNIDYEDRFRAHSLIIQNTPNSSLDKAIKNMEKDLGSSDYNMAAFATKEYYSRSFYKKGDAYKKTAFKLHEKKKIEDKTICIDEYNHSDVIAQVYEYFDPTEAGHMSVQYLFKIYNAQTREWMYNIRVEYVLDILGQYKSQMAVMATLSEDGFRTYWETFSELKSTSYEQWVKYANQIIDNKLKVGSSTIFRKDGGADINIGGDGSSTEEE
jgi:tetratricopeptide (TPR) repeat protein